MVLSLVVSHKCMTVYQFIVWHCLFFKYVSVAAVAQKFTFKEFPIAKKVDNQPVIYIKCWSVSPVGAVVILEVNLLKTYQYPLQKKLDILGDFCR